MQTIQDDKILSFIDDSLRQPCEIWTRVMGYFRPYSGFNIGKKAEFSERKWFKETVCAKNVDNCFEKCVH